MNNSESIFTQHLVEARNLLVKVGVLKDDVFLCVGNVTE